MPLDSPNTRLESAIASVVAAKTRLDRIEELLREIEDKSHTARHRMRDMENAFNVARENESRDVVAVLLDENAPTKSVEDHERDFTQARGDYDRLRGLVLNLQREMQVAERTLHDAEYARKMAVRDLMQQHPAVVAAYEKYASLQAEVAAMNAALHEVFRAGGNPHNWRSFLVSERVERRDYDPSLRDAWVTAIKRLETTGETEFPQ